MSEKQGSSIQRTRSITPKELKEGLEEARTRHVSPWDVLIVEKGISEDTLAATFAQWLKLPRVRLASASVEPEATKAISEALARKYTCLPLKAEGTSLLLAMANPWDYAAIQDVQFASSLTVRPVVASRTEILDGIEGIEFCHLGARDVVRHKIVQDIVEAYRRFGEQRDAAAAERP